MPGFFRLLTILLFVPLSLHGSEYPAARELYVNDYAGVLPADAEARLRASIQDLRRESGVELTVLTIASRQDHGARGSLEDFATGLFNAWGIGDRRRNDGILILVVPGDREMRIELGAGYPAGYDDVAAGIIRDTFLPAFGQGRLGEGIEAGTEAVIARIARRFAAGAPPSEAAEERPASERVGLWAGLSVLMVFAGIGIFGRQIGNRLRRCPQCGTRGLQVRREVTEPATWNRPGKGVEHAACPRCGHSFRQGYTIARLGRRSRGSSSGGSFGGGRSSGGGASGRW